MKKIQFNETVRYITPVDKGKYKLTRTGTIDDNSSSFFHACIMCCEPEEYFSLKSNESKIAKIHELQKKIYAKYREIHNVGMTFDEVKSNILVLSRNFYEYITNGTVVDENVQCIIDKLVYDEKRLEWYKLIIDIIPLDSYTQIFNKMNKEYDESNFDADIYKPLFMKSIFDWIEYQQYLEIHDVEEEKFEQFKEYTCRLINIIVNIIDKQYKKSFAFENEINDDVIRILSDYYECDIYTLNVKTNLPIILKNYHEILKYRQSIILLNINNKYESIGKLLSDNIIQRLFMPNDEIIKSIRNYLKNKKIVLEQKEEKNVTEVSQSPPPPEEESIDIVKGDESETTIIITDEKIHPTTNEKKHKKRSKRQAKQKIIKQKQKFIY